MFVGGTAYFRATACNVQYLPISDCVSEVFFFCLLIIVSGQHSVDYTSRILRPLQVYEESTALFTLPIRYVAEVYFTTPSPPSLGPNQKSLKMI